MLLCACFVSFILRFPCLASLVSLLVLLIVLASFCCSWCVFFFFVTYHAKYDNFQSNNETTSMAHTHSELVSPWAYFILDIVNQSSDKKPPTMVRQKQNKQNQQNTLLSHKERTASWALFHFDLRPCGSPCNRAGNLIPNLYVVQILLKRATHDFACVWLNSHLSCNERHSF